VSGRKLLGISFKGGRPILVSKISMQRQKTKGGGLAFVERGPLGQWLGTLRNKFKKGLAVSFFHLVGGWRPTEKREGGCQKGKLTPGSERTFFWGRTKRASFPRVFNFPSGLGGYWAHLAHWRVSTN